MNHYVIIHGREYLAKRPGWGPTFTDKQEEAQRFPSVSAAYEYRRNNLANLGCKIAKIGLCSNHPDIIC